MWLLLPEPGPLPAGGLVELYGADAPTGVRAGFVVSVDGAAALDGSSRGLQTPADLVAFHALRAVADAVVVGAGTARSEGYGPVRPRPDGAAWRAAHGRPPVPPLVVVSRSLDLDPAARCFTGPAVVVTCAASDPARRAALAEVADVVVAGGDTVDLAQAVVALAERGLHRLLCEGGPQLLHACLRAGVVRELCLTLTPLLVGAAPTLLGRELDAPVRLGLTSLVDGGDGVLLARYAVTADERASGTTG